MPIMRFINRVPGGLMVVPLFLGMLVNSSACSSTRSRRTC